MAKKYRWDQYNEWKEVQGKKDEDKIKPGQCRKCRRGRFQLIAKSGELIRVCCNCGDRVDPESEVGNYE